MTPTSAPGGPSRARRSLTFLASVMLALLSFEAILQNFCRDVRIPDPIFHTIFKPGSSIRECSETCQTSHWTEGGVRGYELPPEGTPRVLGLGDSFTEGVMVGDDEVWTAVLEERLHSRTKAAAVLNVGKPGFSVADYVYLADALRERFRPRWTVIELRDSDLLADAWRKNFAVAHFVRAEDGSLSAVVDPFRDSAARTELRKLRGRSSLIGYAFLRFMEFSEGMSNEPPLFRAAEANSTPCPQEVEYPIEQELDLLRERYDARLSLLYLPDTFDPHGPGAPSPIELRVMRYCQAHDMPLADLRSRFEEFRQRRKSPLGFPSSSFNVGHMNADGHRASGEIVAASLLETGRDFL